MKNWNWKSETTQYNKVNRGRDDKLIIEGNTKEENARDGIVQMSLSYLRQYLVSPVVQLLNTGTYTFN